MYQVRPWATKDTAAGRIDDADLDTMEEAEALAEIYEARTPVVIVKDGYPTRCYPCRTCGKSGRRGSCEHQP